MMTRFIEITKSEHYDWMPIIQWIDDEDSISTSTNLTFPNIEDAFDWIRKELANEQHYIEQLNNIGTEPKEEKNEN